MHKNKFLSLLVIGLFLQGCQFKVSPASFDGQNNDLKIIMRFANNKENVVECSKFINEKKLFDDAKACNDSVYESHLNFDLPNCYVILTKDDSVDTKDMRYNFIPTASIGISEDGIGISIERFLGAYIPSYKVMILVENSQNDLEYIYSHEVHHYLLHMKEIPDGNDHGDEVFSGKCTNQFFDTKTRPNKLYGWWRRFKSLF